MWLRNFFHKIKIGFVRRSAPSIPYTSAAKKFGDRGESGFVYDLLSRLPDCKIKNNIIVRTTEGNAEIDCLVLYKNKLFAVEIKCWKGHLVERDGRFVQYKRDRWTDETHTKIHNSPFKQLNRAVYLLKKENPFNAWLNTVVFFDECDCVETESDNVWFDDIEELTEHIISNGKSSWGNNASLFFNRCVAADFLHCNSWGKSLRCIVCDDSLQFTTPSGILNRQNIHSISISHHWSYDDLKITTRDGACHTVKIENGSVSVIDNDSKRYYLFSKLDYIFLSD